MLEVSEKSHDYGRFCYTPPGELEVTQDQELILRLS
jgi:hypothetical protein